jgi:molybdopterin-guanine dinucleotide biosynthesis protein A
MNRTDTAALILAGGKITLEKTPELVAVSGGVTNRALIPLKGRPMLDYVLDAVRGGLATQGGGRILVAGDDLPLPSDTVAVPGGASLVDTILSGVGALAPEETRLLVVTSDIPFLTAESVADFLIRAREVGNAQFVYPIIRAEDCRKRFPGMKRTTLRVAEGEFTGGNLALLDPGFLRRQEQVIRAAYDRRKRVPALAQMLGPGLLFRLIVSRIIPAVLPIPVLEREVGRLLGGATARAVISPFAEVGTDVDRPEDIEVAERVLGVGY